MVVPPHECLGNKLYQTTDDIMAMRLVTNCHEDQMLDISFTNSPICL